MQRVLLSVLILVITLAGTLAVYLFSAIAGK
jgi:hypothetical protein